MNPVDIGNRLDNTWAGIESPYIVGYEFAGSVSDLNGCDGGDLVVGDPVWGWLPVRGTRWGAYAEQVAVPASMVTRRPKALDAASAATLPLAGGTALQALERLDLQAGEWLLVYGAAGGVGHLLVQLAASRGICVAAVCGREDHPRILGLGAEICVARTEQPSPAASATSRLGHPLDGALDLAGGQLVDAQQHVRDGGHLATIVDLRGDFDDAISRNLTIHGILLQTDKRTLAQLGEAAEAGLRPALRGSYRLAEAKMAHERIEAGGVGGKLVLTMP